MIRAHEVDHFFGTFRALNKVSFTIPANTIAGFIGPNGSGKTTTLRILSGFLVPSSGTVSIDGLSFQEDPIGVRKRIGYMPESPQLYKEMLVSEYLFYVAKLKNIPKAEQAKEVKRLMELCGVEHLKNYCIGTLSKGNRQRVALAQALMGRPSVLLLDEPTSALDPTQVIDMRKRIQELAQNTTVLLSSHILSEISQICNYIVFIKDGTIRYEGPPHVIPTMHSGPEKCIILKFRSLSEEEFNTLKRLPGSKINHSVSHMSARIPILINEEDAFYPAFFRMLSDKKIPLIEMISQETQLELLFQKEPSV